jgi:hypothetical protein
VDASLWGVGIAGLSLHVAGRVGVDLGSTQGWPGTEPAAQVLEGYAEYAAARVTARLGRQNAATGLGTTGFDGARVIVRDAHRGLDAQGYLGWSLARGAALPVTSPALDPLDDFQPRQRQILAGLGVGWSVGRFDARAEYQREVDPRSDQFVAERVAVNAGLGLPGDLRFSAGADYDLASGWWGSADAAINYATPRAQATLEARRYRPHFELWTIWGAFSPVPYHSIQASASIAVESRLRVRGRYERYRFDDAAAETPLFGVERDGWRWEVGLTATPRPEWAADLGYRREFGPGAAAAGFAGSVTFRPSRRFSATLMASSVQRPLEFRFNEAIVRAYAAEADVAPSERVRVGIAAHYYDERHRRPDAGAFEWDQLRASARVTLLFARGADTRGLPPAIRILPGGRSAR